MRKIQSTYTDKVIHITKLDANQFIPEFCSRLARNDRAVLFVDPYSTQLKWNSLHYVANTEKVDLWLLFPISALVRMTPRDGERIRPEWRNKINELLGTNEWEAALYKHKEPSKNMDLFSDSLTDDATERLNVAELKYWLTERLKEVFAHVTEPVLLENNGKPLFLFYFSVSNTDQKAIRLADKVAGYIIKCHAPKSRI